MENNIDVNATLADHGARIKELERRREITDNEIREIQNYKLTEAEKIAKMVYLSESALNAANETKLIVKSMADDTKKNIKEMSEENKKNIKEMSDEHKKDYAELSQIVNDMKIAPMQETIEMFKSFKKSMFKSMGAAIGVSIIMLIATAVLIFNK